MDPGRIDRGTWIAGIAGLILLGLMVLFSWYSVDYGAGAGLVALDAGRNAFQALELIDLVLLAAAIAAVGLVVLTAIGREGSLPVSGAAVITALGAVATLLLIYRIAEPPAALSREIGVYLGLLATAAIAYGGWLSLRESRSAR